MKKILIFCCLFSYFSQNINAQNRCHSNERRALFSIQQISETQNTTPFYLQNRAVVTIPVIVHVVWNNSAEDISDEQIHSQIDVLNEDFRAMNTETSAVPVEFSDVLADVEFEFCLAKIAPNGEPTDGIVREFTNQSVFSSIQNKIFYESEGGSDAWDTESYLNIWVCDLGGNIAGFASFPGTAPPSEDGVVIHYENFGRTAVEPPYHLGRTVTHEVGHFFNLEHVWTNCGDDDGVADTPKSSVSYLQECPAHPETTCGTNDMFMNFMYYTDDACMAMFTEGQKARMWSTLNGFRAGLMNSTLCTEVMTVNKKLDATLKVFPSPTDGLVFLNYDNTKYKALKISVLDVTGFEIMYFANNDGILDLSNLETGIYYLRFETKRGVVIRKIVKI